MNKKLNNTLATLMLLAIGGLCSCTDTWDEHYDGVADSNMFDGTIMEMLQQNPELSNFAKVVEATGFDAELSSSQSYTLWAPENSALTDAEWNSWLELAKTNKKEVINQLIKNHMTRYNISLDEESHIIKLLNTKTGHMSDNSQSLFGSSLITSPNNACKNGVVHIIAKAQPYLRNLSGTEAKMDFIDAFKKVQALKTRLDQYTDLTPEQKETIENDLDEDTLRAFRGAYLETAKEVKAKILDGNSSDHTYVDYDFELVLFASALVDYDYIMHLISLYTRPTHKQKMTKEQLLYILRQFNRSRIRLFRDGKQHGIMGFLRSHAQLREFRAHLHVVYILQQNRTVLIIFDHGVPQLL